MENYTHMCMGMCMTMTYHIILNALHRTPAADDDVVMGRTLDILPSDVPLRVPTEH